MIQTKFLSNDCAFILAPVITYPLFRINHLYYYTLYRASLFSFPLFPFFPPPIPLYFPAFSLLRKVASTPFFHLLYVR